MQKKKVILVTGNAGFIGYHVAKSLMSKRTKIIGIDNINSYYDTKVKIARLKDLKNHSNKNNYFYIFKKIDIDKENSLKYIFKKFKINYVIHLAAQAGVRYSILHPEQYIKSNIKAFSNILQCCNFFRIKHLLYASTSSVYGANKKIPFEEKDVADHPIQLYAATKRSNELMAHAYSNLFSLHSTGLRFFTVYGPWGRPDMALFLFTKNILKKKPIEVFNYGNHVRDFTYIDDVVDGIVKINSKKFPIINLKKNTPSESTSPYRILNIGNNNPVPLQKYINLIEKELNIKAIRHYKPMQKGDIQKTHASIRKIKKLYNYKPKTKVEIGIKNFVRWYKEYYEVK